MAEDKTNVEVNRETWQRLNSLKQEPSDTFDDVIQRLLDEHEDQSES